MKKTRERREPQAIDQIAGRKLSKAKSKIEVNKEIGEMIQKAREKLKLSREELAIYTGYTAAGIKGIETQGRGINVFKYYLFARLLKLANVVG